MEIKYLELKKITAMHGEEIQEAVNSVVESGWYLQGESNRKFEELYAEYCHAKYCVGCANGLDALTLSLRSLMEMGEICEGDEVIVPANTYIATILAITENHLKAVLVEPRHDTFQINDQLIEEAITPRTKAIMLVNLYGKDAYTPLIGDLCNKYNLRLIIDNAQGHGLIPHPSFLIPHPSSPVACHSFYPGKNLGALGDGGAITTDDKALADTFRAMANYGSSRKYVFDYCGRNSRLDEIQAAVLSIKLKYLDNDNRRRRDIAMRYIKEVNNPLLKMPSEEYWHDNVFHIFPVMCGQRDALQRYLADKGIQTVIHYPIPPHKQQCYASSPLLVIPEGGLPITERIHREELSLPCNPAMTDEEVEYVIGKLRSYTSIFPI
ncbi:MAG: DegT/DnrJ/EryC1/StrS family aminotransferase [Prevotella sp.]|nr:DegT/DnrJ/EryC1/StrS family aminotransferase [Prevotella sp.]